MSWRKWWEWELVTGTYTIIKCTTTIHVIISYVHALVFMYMCCNVECKLHLQYLQAPDLSPHTCVGVGRFWSVCLCWCQFCSDTPGCCLRLCSWHTSRRSLKRGTISRWLNRPVDMFILFHTSFGSKYVHVCSLPSRQERLNVSVGSISFLILMRASRTMGPQLH